MDEQARLIEGAAVIGLQLAGPEAQRLLRLLDELQRWNRTYNLTAIDAREAMLTHHLLDSLAVHPHLHGTRIADVGTGAGFPGLPLAVANPQRHFTLVDASNKKIRFVSHAVRALGLANVEPLHARAEALRPEQPFDTVVTRAFAALPETVRLVQGLCGSDTRLIAMKGKRPDEEIAALPPAWRLLDVVRTIVPGLDELRHLVILQPA